MKTPAFRPLRSLILTLAVSTLALSAQSGRELAVTYNFADPIFSNDEVRLRLTVRVVNSGEANIVNASVRVLQEDPAARNRRRKPDESTLRVAGELNPVSVQAGFHERTDGSVTVSKAEFESWSEGRQPVLRIEFTDAAGKVQSREVNASRQMELTETK